MSSHSTHRVTPGHAQGPTRLRIGLAAVAAVVLSSCGGGSSDSGSSSPRFGPSSDAIGVTALAFASDQLPIGLKDEPYEADLQGRGGEPPYRFALAGGELPPGLALDGSQGRITGRPARVGEFGFTLRATDARGTASTQTFTIFISESQGSEEGARGMAPRTDFSRKRAAAVDPNAVPDLSNLLNIVASMSEGTWRRVNLNQYSDVWTPAELRPLYGFGNPTPSKIILAWSSFAWDTKRATLILYGGGHANYRGNDVYMWRAASQSWERAALPSEMVQDPLANWNAIDGSSKAPASAHTYDNNIYLPGVDRMLVFGGAADPNGGHYLTQDTATTSRNTGVYLFDPSRAHPDKVGGTTGSHVQREGAFENVIGGEMWSNRESWLTLNPAPPVESMVNACTGYANEAGADVVYLRTRYRIYRYQIGDLGIPSSDRWDQVGRFWFAGSGAQATCAYDPTQKVLLSTNTASKPFVAWNLATPGPNNRDIVITPADPDGEFLPLLSSGQINLSYCGLDHDPNRGDFKLWCGGGRVWSITAPTVIGSSGWTIRKAADPVAGIPTESIGTGILGKWKYIPNLDVFLALLDPVQGNIWIYKPVGWVNPAGTGNLPPSVTITNPVDGASIPEGSDVLVSADALDGDGSVAKVEFFVGGTKIGESLAPPYAVTWMGVTAGSWEISARATDDQGATRDAPSVFVTVDSTAPPNAAPSVSLSSPADGTVIAAGSPVTLEAQASDTDGQVVEVAFFDGGTRLGAATAAPFRFVWSNPPPGVHALTAVALDDQGASTASAPVALTVNSLPGGTVTLTLQRDLSPGIVVRDTYLSSYHPTLNFGTATGLLDQTTRYSSLLRFQVFQSEGGPVPDGALIRSAVLSIYKYSFYNMVYTLHRMLVDWSESSATWTDTGVGGPWNSPGANGAGIDFQVAPDASASTNFEPGWVDFDLTASLTPNGAPFGWRLRQQSGYLTGLKRFYTSEFDTSTELRPKLVITYE